jgi:glutamate/tyrosine decarboxylase-like PLP-dependent enzyme
MTHYQQLLEQLRKAFPQPVSDPVHDGYVVFSILRALDQVDALKSQRPILGEPTDPDYDRAKQYRVTDAGQTLEAVIPELVKVLQGMFIWGHPQSQINVVPNPTIASIVGYLLPMIYNPNLVSEESSRLFAEAEVRAAAMVAELVGYAPKSATGFFTFGGTGTMLYGLKVGLEKACPGAREQGVKENVVLIASEQSHYCCLTVASWLGIGQQNVISVPTSLDNAMRVDRLEQLAREALQSGRKIAGIVATMGTTDEFGVDDLQAIVAVRDRLVADFNLPYKPHVHADAVIGWAWSVFNDYSFTTNTLGFRGRTVRALAATQRKIAALKLADSLGVDFHKTGYAPYVSSLVLFSDRGQLGLLARTRDSMPYLFQSGEHHPGMATLETSRSAGGAMAALANLLLLGKEGYRTLLGHAVEMAEVLRETIESHPNLTLLNGQCHGPVTLFRVYPDGVDTFTIKDRERTDSAMRDLVRSYNDYNRRIFDRVHAQALAGNGVVLSLTSCYRETDYGEPIVALKSYVLSPFADEMRMQSIVEHVLAAREEALKRSRESGGWLSA